MRAMKLEFLHINSRELRHKQEENQREKRQDWLILGEDGDGGLL